jgi:pimeloyl-ACP methyl ester carboxylesterase
MFHSIEVEDIFAVFDFELLSHYIRLVRIELPAHGLSKLPESVERHTWSSIGSDIREIAISLGFDRYFIGGFSQGAGISAHACINNPNVIGLVVSMLPKIWDERRSVRKTYAKLVRQLEMQNGRIVLERVFGLAKYAPDEVGWNKEDAEKINELMLQITTETAIMILNGAIKSDMPEKYLLKSFSLPALLVGWEGDSNHPCKSFQDAHKILQTVDYFLLDNRLHVKSATFRLLAFIFMYL